MTEPAGTDVDEVPRRRTGLTHRGGLTNGVSDDSKGMEVDVGLINGLPEGGRTAGKPRLSLTVPFVRKRRRRAALDALEHKALEPLPGSDGK